MRITDLEPIVVRLPTVTDDLNDDTQDAFLLRVHTDEGISGIGEADSAPFAARAIVNMPSSARDVRGLRDILIGRDPLDIGALWHDMYEGTSYYGRSGLTMHVISAVDIALWDIAGKAYGKPVHQLLGGARRSEVSMYASALMPDSVESAIEVCREAAVRGYSALKLGWGPIGRSRGSDALLIRAARQALEPEQQLMIDAGFAYTVKGALLLLKDLEDVDLYWLEEPLRPEDRNGYRRLSDATTVRIAAGENEDSENGFRELVEHARVDVLQPDLSRCGGFTVGQRIAELGQLADVEIVPHCFSSGVLVAASLHFAACLDRATYCEYPVTGSPLVDELVGGSFAPIDGVCAVPQGPGLGVELDEAMLSRFRVE
jgi:L-rhamnonate dehydratase